jgi:hypothetical protein
MNIRGVNFENRNNHANLNHVNAKKLDKVALKITLEALVILGLGTVASLAAALALTAAGLALPIVIVSSAAIGACTAAAIFYRKEIFNFFMDDDGDEVDMAEFKKFVLSQSMVSSKSNKRNLDFEDDQDVDFDNDLKFKDIGNSNHTKVKKSLEKIDQNDQFLQSDRFPQIYAEMVNKSVDDILTQYKELDSEKICDWLIALAFIYCVKNKDFPDGYPQFNVLYGAVKQHNLDAENILMQKMASDKGIKEIVEDSIFKYHHIDL